MVDTVSVREVGLRDGLQLVTKVLPTEIKIEWMNQQVDCGFRDIEVTSLVAAKLLPQFADAQAVLDAAKTIPSLKAGVLVPNLKWGLRALDQGAKKITFVLSVSETHNQANVRRSTDQSIVEFEKLVAHRNTCGLSDDVVISAVMATAFGCSLQGEVSKARVFKVADKLLAAGADELNIADTVGYANPHQVKQLMTQISKQAGSIQLAAHFHDTRGMGLANVVAAVEAGVRCFDASLGGLGGCPFAKGASGNVATEDCVYLLENMGLATGIDLQALLDLRRQLGQWLMNEPLEGKLLKAGLAKTFNPQLLQGGSVGFEQAR